MTIQSRPSTDDYRAGWDRVFGRSVRICPPLNPTLKQSNCLVLPPCNVGDEITVKNESVETLMVMSG